MERWGSNGRRMWSQDNWVLMGATGACLNDNEDSGERGEGYRQVGDE